MRSYNKNYITQRRLKKVYYDIDNKFVVLPVYYEDGRLKRNYLGDKTYKKLCHHIERRKVKDDIYHENYDVITTKCSNIGNRVTKYWDKII